MNQNFRGLCTFTGGVITCSSACITYGPQSHLHRRLWTLAIFRFAAAATHHLSTVHNNNTPIATQIARIQHGSNTSGQGEDRCAEEGAINSCSNTGSLRHRGATREHTALSTTKTSTADDSGLEELAGDHPRVAGPATCIVSATNGKWITERATACPRHTHAKHSLYTASAPEVSSYDARV